MRRTSVMHATDIRSSVATEACSKRAAPAGCPSAHTSSRCQHKPAATWLPAPPPLCPPEIRTYSLPATHLTGHSMACPKCRQSCTYFASADVAVATGAAPVAAAPPAAGPAALQGSALPAAARAAARQPAGSSTSAMAPHMLSGTSVPAGKVQGATGVRARRWWATSLSTRATAVAAFPLCCATHASASPVPQALHSAPLASASSARWYRRTSAHPTACQARSAAEMPSSGA